MTIAHAGKGAAVRSGVLATSGDLVLVTDADLSTPIEELDQLQLAIEAGAGLAVGSRHLASSRVELKQPIHRRVMSKVFNLLVQVLVLRGVRDTQCGFKLFHGALAREIFSVAQVDGFAFDVEAILLARRLGARVAEVPVEWYDVANSRVRALRDSAAMFVELLAIRRRARGARRLPTGVAVVRPEAAASLVSRLGRPGELVRVFWLAFAAYLAAGAFLVLHDHLLAGDAYSRVAIAHRILFSRDPHLAAIGFVWSPLPILALLPLVPLGSVWPALTGYGFAASVVSALCMAGAAREVAAFLRDMGVRQADRLLLTLAFAAHPLVVLYAANGMSEAMFLLFLLMATRRLAGWLRTGDVALGTGAALALAAAYLARYEALAAAAVAVALVAASAYRRTPGAARQRLEQAACDAAVLGAPVLVAFACLTLASWIITGNPLEQFSSTYGNSAQLQVWGVSPATAGVRAYTALATSQVLILEPFVVVVAALAFFRAWRHGGGAAALAVGGTVGSVLAFMFLSSARGQVDHQLRYMITAVPLSVLTAGSILALRPSSLPTPTRRSPRISRWPRVRGGGTGVGAGGLAAVAARRRPAALAMGAATVVMVALALPVSAYEMTSSQVNPSESVLVRATYGARGGAELRAELRFTTERRIAADLDTMHLAPESVLIDDFLGFAVPLNSRNPKQFVITSDRDFRTVLSDPAASGSNTSWSPSRRTWASWTRSTAGTRSFTRGAPECPPRWSGSTPTGATSHPRAGGSTAFDRRPASDRVGDSDPGQAGLATATPAGPAEPRPPGGRPGLGDRQLRLSRRRRPDAGSPGLR